MLKILQENVYGLKEAIISSGYPMTSGNEPKYSEDRAIRLAQTPLGSGHSNFLKGIVVQFDVKYANYWTPQFQRYSHIDIVSSNSKMHRLTKMDIKECCNEFVDDIVIENLNRWIEIYNGFPLGVKSVKVGNITMSDGFGQEQYGQGYIYRGESFSDKYGRDVVMEERIGIWMTKHEVFMKIISNCPMGLEQIMSVSTNYLQLKTIYNQRRHHKLDDWQVFCDWIETLPMAKELII